MIPQLERRLKRYVKQLEKFDKEYQDGKRMFQTYFMDRFELDKKIMSVFELGKKQIKERVRESESELVFSGSIKLRGLLLGKENNRQDNVHTYRRSARGHHEIFT